MNKTYSNIIKFPESLPIFSPSFFSKINSYIKKQKIEILNWVRLESRNSSVFQSEYREKEVGSLDVGYLGQNIHAPTKSKNIPAPFIPGFIGITNNITPISEPTPDTFNSCSNSSSSGKIGSNMFFASSSCSINFLIEPDLIKKNMYVYMIHFNQKVLKNGKLKIENH